jgi:hypothetical protein
MSKAKKILSLLSKGKSIEEVAKATKSSEAYVYYVRWTDKKGKAAPKKKKSKIVKAVKEVKQALDAIESKPTKLLVRPEHKDAALKLLNMKEADPVNHPPHYKTGGIETIDFIEAKDLNYRLGNVIKYVSRAGKKETDPVQDLEKAMFYLKREIDVRKSA